MFWRKQRERDLERELRGHLDLEASERREQGLSPREAEFAARRALGNTARIQEEVRIMWGWTNVEALCQDLRYAFRQLGRAPGFTAVAILTLAVGIGSASAIFSVVNAVLLRPLPYRDPSRLVSIHDGMSSHDSEGWPACMADFLLWREHAHSFSHLAVFGYDDFAMTGQGDAEQVSGARVSAGFFETLGVHPMLGRGFDAGADRPGQPAVAVISERLWRRKFGAREDIVGKVVTLDGRSTTVIGVLGAGFAFPARTADLWVILPLNPPNRRGPFFLQGVARLAPRVTLGQASRDLDALGREVEAADPLKLEHARYPVAPLQGDLVNKVETLLLVLAGTVGLVLLIAVFNVANLMLARATGRRREIAMRLSIGASRGRLIRQLLTESLTLALLGGAAGVALAFGGVAVLRNMAPPGLPRLDEIMVDARVLLIALLASVASGVFFGLAPALAVTRDAPGAALKEGARAGAHGGAWRLRGALVMAEMALSLMLLAGAGLLMRSFVLLGSVPTGFQAPPGRLLAMEISLSGKKYGEEAARNRYWQQVVDRVRAVPGVEDAAVTITMPPDRTAFTDGFEIPDKTPPEGGPLTPVPYVSANYFQTMGIPLLRGRAFDERDRLDSPPVAIISETMARRYFPGENPVGQRMKHGGPHQDLPYREIVGVAADVKYSGLDGPAEPVYYEPAAQSPVNQMWLVARTRGAAAGATVPVSAAVRSLDPNVPVSELNAMSEVLRDSVDLPRFRVSLMGVFAFAAVLLACIGLYGVMAHYVAQRTHEIGIRMALGADPGGVLNLVVGRALRLAAGGVAAGMLGAAALLRFLKTLLFGIEPYDAGTLIAVAMLLTAVAMLAAWLPARRAARIDPIEALREE